MISPPPAAEVVSQSPRAVYKEIEGTERMTKRNVVFPDAAVLTKPSISMAIAQKVSSSPLFPCASMQSASSTDSAKKSSSHGSFMTLTGTKLWKKQENGGGVAKYNGWMDSLLASSPTHIKSPASFPAVVKDRCSWILRHPSALRMFEHITNASKGKQIVMFLDYDGTLSPIVDDPDKAFMSDAMRNVVEDVARCFPTAIVSGRCRDKVYGFVKLAGIYYAGSHGMDIKIPAECKKGNKPVLFQPASEFLPMIDEVYKALVEKTKSIPGAKVEDNKFCLSVHFRRVEEKNWRELAEQVKSVLKEYPKLRINQGRKVLEIRPAIKWDKGKALEFLLESLGFSDCNSVLPLYIGDDRTDEDAFKVLRDRGQGFGILVSKIPKTTNACFSLQEPSEVKDFLSRLVEWKKSRKEL